MDVTTIQCGRETRDRLRDYKQSHGFKNYDEAIQSLISAVEGDSDD